MFDNVFATPV